MASRWPQVGSKMAEVGSKMAQVGSKMALDGSKTAQQGAKTPPGRPKSARKRLAGGSSKIIQIRQVFQRISRSAGCWGEPKMTQDGTKMAQNGPKMEMAQDGSI